MRVPAEVKRDVDYSRGQRRSRSAAATINARFVLDAERGFCVRRKGAAARRKVLEERPGRSKPVP